VAARLRTRGAVVEYVLATEAASSVPFGALAGLLEPTSGLPGDLLDVLRNAGARLARRAGSGGLALIVDDAHRPIRPPPRCCCSSSRVTRHGVRVLATVRADTAAPDAVTSLWKDAGLLRVDLDALSEESAGEAVRHFLRGPVEQQTSRWLWERSAGNPLFLRELVLAEPAELSLLERLGALEGATALETRGLVAAAELEGGTALRVGHPLYGEALRATLKLTEVRALHAELAEHLDPDAEGVRLRLATWALEDGLPGSSGLYAAAAKEALAVFDPELAIRLGGAAVAASPESTRRCHWPRHSGRWGDSPRPRHSSPRSRTKPYRVRA
jgi:hypothetical protein